MVGCRHPQVRRRRRRYPRSTGDAGEGVTRFVQGRTLILAGIAAATLVACQPVKKPPPPPEGPTLAAQTNFVTGLDHPWDIGFLPDGTMFFTERTGPIRVRLPNGTINLIADPADEIDGGEGGMLGLAVDPQFASNRYVFTCFSSNAGGTPDNRLVRWTINPGFNGFSARTDVVPGLPYNVVASGRHSGCRPRFGPDGFLWIGTGDAATGINPQSGTSLGGKTLRVDRNGAAAPGNSPPSGFDIRIYTYGHRNVQGMAFRPGNGQAYGVEHGPECDDEVNRLLNGQNYGWDPVPGYNETVPMTDFNKFPDAIGAVWSSGCPTIAPSGATFLSGSQWEAWEGALAVAVLHRNEGGLLRVFFLNAAGDQVTGFVDATMVNAPSPLPRLRSAVQGPDGNLYITTDVGGGGGAIWRVTPS
jgi:glucose/arabinose dehydrogenase